MFCGRKVGEFGESSAICQAKSSKWIGIINNLLANQFINQALLPKCYQNHFWQTSQPNFPTIRYCVSCYVALSNVFKLF